MADKKKAPQPPIVEDWADAKDSSTHQEGVKSKPSDQEPAHGDGKQEVPPVVDGEGRGILAPPTLAPPDTRVRSPSQTRLSAALSLRIMRQGERQRMLSNFAREIEQALDLKEPTDRLDHWEKRIEEICNEARDTDLFILDHWPSGNLNHPYFTEQMFLAISNTRNNCLLVLSRLKKALGAAESARRTTSSAPVKFPKLELPTFSGAYQEWANFAELFRSMVLDSDSIPEVQKLQYLKTSVKGEANQLIANVPLMTGHLEDAWNSLVARYEDKGRVIASYLDRVLDLKPCTSSSQGELRKIYGVIVDAEKAIQSLSGDHDIGDILWAHLLAKNLDSRMRRDLAVDLGRSKEPYTFANVAEYVRNQLRAIESAETTRQDGTAKKPAAQSSAPARPSAKGSSLQVSAPPQPTSSYKGYSCDCCQGSHYLTGCPAFLRKSAVERRALVIEKRLCFNCMGRHSARACKSTQFCKTCRGKHHTMLHDASQQSQPARTTIEEKPGSSRAQRSSRELVGNTFTASALSATQVLCSSSQSLLATAVAIATTKTTSHRIRLLVDPGSEFSFVTEELVSSLQLKRLRSHLIVTGIGGSHTTRTKGAVELSLASVYTSEGVAVQAHVLGKIASALPSADVITEGWSHLQNLELADPLFFQSRAIDVLLGADVYGQIIKPDVVRGTSSSPIAQLSTFGWLVIGPVTALTSPRQNTSLFGRIDHDSLALQDLLTRFWEQEEVPTNISATLSPDDQECEEHFQRTHSRDETGRYIVRLPLKAPASLLGDSSLTARHRLQGILRRLARDNEYKELYMAFLKEYEELGHMACASNSLRRSEKPVEYYLPHHGVLRPERVTTKLRVVFDGSSKSLSGHSLNDLMHTGANLLLDVSNVLLWIRLHRHLFATDVTKMYRQIKVHEEDQDLQRILWVDEDFNVVPYRLTTVTYGTKSAPFLAVRTMLQLAEDEGANYPLAVPSILHGRYVDDIFGGADTEEDLLETARQLKGLCHAGGFPLAKWHASSPSIIAQLGTSDDRKTIDFDDCATKLLGIQWSPKDDKFSFSSRLSTDTGIITKRMILSEVAKIFDPLGFISPVTIRAKMLIQELWLHKVGWDEPLPIQVLEKWRAVREDFSNLASLSVPRWFNTCSGARVQLHGFSDASQLAIAAVVYLTVDTPSTGKVTSLICSKSKVAPLKRLTIPRLELAGALLLSRLVHHVKATARLDTNAIFLWTDSTVVLTWITAHPSRWKDYVRNRVTQIQELTQDCSWMHVPGTCNPADCASRGTTTAELADHRLWWTGPSWLNQPTEKWPRQTDVSDAASNIEARPGLSLVGTLPEPDCRWDLLFRYCSFFKLIRVTALCFRVVDRLRRVPNTPSGLLVLPSELQRARRFWVKATQAAAFAAELKALSKGNSLLPTHPLSRLTAFIDSDGILRVGGRLKNSTLDEEAKHPAILPRNAHLSSLIIDEAHRKTLHGGTQLTLAYIRQRFWILGGRYPVKTHVLRCVICARQRGIRAHQLMGQLPLCRVTPSRPFLHTGVDYAGPVTLKTWQGRGAKTHKAWLCVFVCFSTSAVHLDVVTDYSTEAFLASFRRFTSRRGIPSQMYSDCGTNFLGAEAALKQMFTASAREHWIVSQELSKEGIGWSFNPPAAPHMGGKWEAAVKSVKFHLRRTVGESLFTYEQLVTLITQIEAILNSRPLEPLSDDPEDLAALTPGHFLVGTALTTVPEPSLLDLGSPRLSYWQQLQQRLQQFWKTWSSQYLHQQQAISKWQYPQDAIKVGSLVLITDERSPPGRWPLARVTHLHPGVDGLTRVVTLKTATTTLTRPITKLSPLFTDTPTT